MSIWFHLLFVAHISCMEQTVAPCSPLVPVAHFVPAASQLHSFGTVFCHKSIYKPFCQINWKGSLLIMTSWTAWYSISLILNMRQKSSHSFSRHATVIHIYDLSPFHMDLFSQTPTSSHPPISSSAGSYIETWCTHLNPWGSTWSRTKTSWVLTVFPSEHVSNTWVTQVLQKWKTLTKTGLDRLADSKGEEKVEDREWDVQTVSV